MLKHTQLKEINTKPEKQSAETAQVESSPVQKEVPLQREGEREKKTERGGEREHIQAWSCL